MGGEGASCGQHMLQPATTGVLPALPPACAWHGLGGSLFLISLCPTACPDVALPQNYGNPHVFSVMKSKKWQGNGLSWWKTSGFAAWRHSSAMCCLCSWGKSVLLPAFWQPPVLSTVIHHQALCIHPIATRTANSPRVSAGELLWRLLSRFLLEAELCCFANQHSSWVNTT